MYSTSYSLSAQTSTEDPYEAVSEDYILNFHAGEMGGYMDMKGNVIVEPNLYMVDWFEDGIVISTRKVEGEQQQGIHNTKGEIIYSFDKQNCQNLGNGMALISSPYKKRLFHKDKGIIFSCDSCNIGYDPQLQRIFLHKTDYMGSHHPIDVYTLDSVFIFSTYGRYMRRMHNEDYGKISYLPYYKIEAFPENNWHQLMDLNGNIIFDSVSISLPFQRFKNNFRFKNAAAFLDTNLNPIVPLDSGYQAFSLLYEEEGIEYYQVRKDSLFGIMNGDGQLTIPFQFKTPVHPREGFLIHADPEKENYHFFNKKGEYAFPSNWVFHDKQSIPFKGKTLYRVSNAEGKYGFIDQNSDTVLGFDYDFLSPIREGIIVYFKGDQSGYMTIEGRIVAEINQALISDVVEGVGIIAVPLYNAQREDYPCAQITVSDKAAYALQYQYIDTTGTLLSDFGFDWAYPMHNGIALAMKDCQLIWLDSSIQPATVNKLYLQSHFKDGVAVVRNKRGKYGLIDEIGKIVLECEYDEIPIQKGESIRFRVYSKNRKPDYKVNHIKYPDSNGGTLRAKKGDHWGLFSITGEEILDLTYDVIKLTEDKLLYKVYKDSKAGLYNLDGTEVLPTEYDYIGKNAPYGFYDIRKGEMGGKVHYKGKVYWPKP